LLKVWEVLENEQGTPEGLAKVQGLMPIKGTRRHVDQESGQAVEGKTIRTPLVLDLVALTPATFLQSEVEWIFADDERESNPTTFKFLQMAHAWKNSQGKKVGAGSTALSGFTAATTTTTRREEDAASDVASSHGGD
jgi:crooked neck